MEWWVQDKQTFSKFIARLAERTTVIAPVMKDAARFVPVKSAEEIYLDNLTYFPAKEYFFRQQETLFTFKNGKLSVPKQEHQEKVFFGLRKCDLNAIKHQDDVYTRQVPDPYYTAARAKTILIGYHCWEAPNKYCFCESLNLSDYYDLLYFDKGDHYLIHAGSEEGARFLKSHKRFFTPTEQKLTKEERVIKNADRLEKDDIGPFYDHKGWKEGVDLCLSCGACTNLCPTCYCFEIHDEVNAKDPSSGKRTRTWSSCQLPEFTKVAGDHVFRESREDRFKHRIYHQLDYFKKEHGINLCVGCGRCISGCPTRIDFVHIINKMK